MKSSMGDILSGRLAFPRWAIWTPARIRVVNWNIDRGLRLEGIISFLRSARADILILQEVDLDARRTGFRNIAEEIAKRLRMNYSFGYEFQELTQGRRDAPAYHGQATLSCWPIQSSRVIRFSSVRRV
jgi:endonuclease/exonuclease/phosphatase family metal-dependent hydrolase